MKHYTSTTEFKGGIDLQGPEDLSGLHHGVEVLGGFGLSAENMLQPDPVILLGVEGMLVSSLPRLWRL